MSERDFEQVFISHDIEITNHWEWQRGYFQVYNGNFLATRSSFHSNFNSTTHYGQKKKKMYPSV